MLDYKTLLDEQMAQESEERRGLAQLSAARHELRGAIDALERAEFALADNAPRLAALCDRQREALRLIARWLNEEFLLEANTLNAVKPLAQRFVGVDGKAN
jgi:hypothetical protein